MKKEEKLFLKNKGGQLTIFIIIAVFVVALGAMIFLFFPGVLVNVGVGTDNPSRFIQTCMEDEIKGVVNNLSLQGGSLNPENYFLHENSKVEYLCYTEEDYKPCVVQQPLLNQHIENEIKENIRATANDCFNSLKENFESQGFDVNMNRGETNVELLPQRIVVAFNNDLTLTKGETQRFEQIRVVLNNNLYELISIAGSIIDFESKYGDAETTVYMDYYPYLKVEKKKQSDGSTIYILTDRDGGDKFQFASRSFVFPPGI